MTSATVFFHTTPFTIVANDAIGDIVAIALVNDDIVAIAAAIGATFAVRTIVDISTIGAIVVIGANESPLSSLAQMNRHCRHWRHCICRK